MGCTGLMYREIDGSNKVIHSAVLITVCEKGLAISSDGFGELLCKVLSSTILKLVGSLVGTTKWYVRADVQLSVSPLSPCFFLSR